MALWDDVKGNLVEWYTLTSDKTTEAVKIGSRRWDKFGISRDIERQFSELGSLIYVGIKDEKEDILAQEEVLGLIQRIELLEEELKTKGQEIDTIKAEYAKAASAGGPDTTFDPDGEEVVTVTETVLKDPVLDVGSVDSAILVEPLDIDHTDVVDTGVDDAGAIDSDPDDANGDELKEK